LSKNKIIVSGLGEKVFGNNFLTLKILCMFTAYKRKKTK